MAEEKPNEEKEEAPPEKSEEKPKDAEVKQDAKVDEVKQEAKSDEATPASEETAQSVLADGDEETPAAEGARQGKRKNLKRVPFGIAHVRATFNNTLVTITDSQGEVVGWSSGGRSGFKGSRKSTAFAAGRVGQDAARQAMSRGMKEVEVRVQGPGAGRETAIRALQSAGLTIAVIKDVTPMPHNGCRPRKRRRV